jgi:hypothetical protein
MEEKLRQLCDEVEVTDYTNEEGKTRYSVKCTKGNRIHGITCCVSVEQACELLYRGLVNEDAN